MKWLVYQTLEVTVKKENKFLRKDYQYIWLYWCFRKLIVPGETVCLNYDSSNNRVLKDPIISAKNTF